MSSTTLSGVNDLLYPQGGNSDRSQWKPAGEAPRMFITFATGHLSPGASLVAQGYEPVSASAGDTC